MLLCKYGMVLDMYLLVCVRSAFFGLVIVGLERGGGDWDGIEG